MEKQTHLEVSHCTQTSTRISVIFFKAMLAFQFPFEEIRRKIIRLHLPSLKKQNKTSGQKITAFAVATDQNCLLHYHKAWNCFMLFQQEVRQSSDVASFVSSLPHILHPFPARVLHLRSMPQTNIFLFKGNILFLHFTGISVKAQKNFLSVGFFFVPLKDLSWS